MTINSLLIFVIVLIFCCCGSTKPEITKALEMLEDAKKYVNSDEAKIISKRIANKKVLSNQFVNNIDESKSPILIESKNEIIKTSNILINLIEEIIVNIENKHGKDDKGDILNKRESKFVNQVMFDDKMATRLKMAINESIENTIKIISQNQLQITKEELPLKLNLFMESNGKKWEEYNFLNMPFGAVMPIFSTFKNNALLNKLLVLVELSEKVKN